MTTIVRAVGLGMLVMLAGTIPRNIAFAANLRYLPAVPWAVPLTAAYLVCFWRYLDGWGPPDSSREFRRHSLRANALPGRVWPWALLSGGLGVVALVLALRLTSRVVALPHQQLPSLAHVPPVTVWSLLLMAAPLAGVVEEAAFRGYMQRPIERRHGLPAAILITGSMFAVAHLDFTLILWPYYVTVAAIYGSVTYVTDSVWPAVVLHTAGNTYSNIDLLLHGRAEWQSSSGTSELVWTTGIDRTFLRAAVALLLIAVGMAWAYAKLKRAARESLPPGAGAV